MIAAYHAAALLAFMPGYFSWSGLIVAMLGTHLCGLFGINLCYHRLLTHRGLKCPKWLEHAMVIVAMSCLQETPARWVAVHRRHHQYADEQPDPHSPLASFFWAHIGWILVDQPELARLGIYQRYARDILRDRFYVALERHNWLVWINLGQMPLFFGAGFAAGLLSGETPAGAAQTGLGILMFGVFVRTVLVWHITWAVNSVTHLWGYRSYETDEDSRNNIVVGLIANGEGWHNNHHADPRSARHGHRTQRDFAVACFDLTIPQGWMVSPGRTGLTHLRLQATVDGTCRIGPISQHAGDQTEIIDAPMMPPKLVLPKLFFM